MSWDIEFTSQTKDAALTVWDKRVRSQPDYTKEHGKHVFEFLRESLEQFLERPSCGISVKTYGDFSGDGKGTFWLTGLFIKIGYVTFEA